MILEEGAKALIIAVAVVSEEEDVALEAACTLISALAMEGIHSFSNSKQLIYFLLF